MLAVRPNLLRPRQISVAPVVEPSVSPIEFVGVQRNRDAAFWKTLDVVVNEKVNELPVADELLCFFQFLFPALAATDHHGDLGFLWFKDDGAGALAGLVRTGFDLVELEPDHSAVALDAAQSRIVRLSRLARAHIIEAREVQRVPHE